MRARVEGIPRRTLILVGWAALVLFIWWGVPYVTAVTVGSIGEVRPGPLPEAELGTALAVALRDRVRPLLGAVLILWGCLAAAGLSWFLLLPAVGLRGPATWLATLVATLYVATTPYATSLANAVVVLPGDTARESAYMFMGFAVTWLFAVALSGFLLRLEPRGTEGLGDVSLVDFRLGLLVDEGDDEAYARTLVAICADALAADRCSLFFVHPNRGELRSRYGTGLKADIHVPLGAGFVGHAVRTGQAVNVADAYLDARFDRSADRRTGYRTRSVLAVPLRARGGTAFGVLQALNKRGGPFETRDRRLLEHIATAAGRRLERMHAAEVLAPAS